MNKITLLLLFFVNLSLQAQNNYKANTIMKKINENTYETDKIKIIEKPQKTYQLILKAGKPFEGYEVTNDLILGELPLVNYYENGELKTQYSVDYIAKDQYGGPQEFTLKTTFKNNIIENGYSYREFADKSSSILFTNIYKNGKIIAFQFNAFAMHSFERLTFELVDNTIIISRLGSKESLKIYKVDGIFKSDFLIDGNAVETSTTDLEFVKEGTPLSTSVFYLNKKNELESINLKYIQRKYFNSDDEFLLSIYMKFSFKYEGSVHDVFRKLTEITKITNNDEFIFSNIFDNLFLPYNTDNIRGYVSYDSEGKIQDGDKIFKNAYNTFTIETYKKGEIIDTKKLNDIINYKIEY